MRATEISDGLPIPDGPPAATDTAAIRRQVQSVLTDCNAIVASLADPIKQAVRQCVAQCASVDADCRACLSGQIEALLTAAGSAALTCRQRVMDAATNYIGTAAYHANEAFGYQPPDVATMTADLQAGQFPTVGVLARRSITGPCPNGSEPVGQYMTPNGPINVCAGPNEPCSVPERGFPHGGGPNTPPGYGLSGGGSNEGSYVVATPLCSTIQPLPIVPPISAWPPVTIPPPAPPPAPPPPATCPPPPPPIIIPNCPPPPPVPSDEFIALVDIKDQASVRTDFNRPDCPPMPGDGPKVSQDQQVKDLEKWTGWSHDGQTKTMPTGMENLLTQIAAPDWVKDAIWGIGHFMLVNLASIVTGIGDSMQGCAGVDVGEDLVGLALIGIIEKWAGCDLSFIGQKIRMDIARQCPTNIPGQGEVNDLFNRGWINRDTWKCWTRVNDNLDVPASIVQEAARPVPPYQLAYKAEKLGKVPVGSADSVAALNGWDVNRWASYLTQSVTYVPGAGEAIDIAFGRSLDIGFVNKWGLDAGFNGAYQGIVQQWLNAAGVSSDLAKILWANQFKLPSFGELCQWRIRISPDDPDPKLAQLAIGDDEFRLMARSAGIPSQMIDALFALQERRFSKGEVNRGYYLGVLSRPDAELYYRKLGYTIADAKIAVQVQDAVNFKKDAGRPLVTSAVWILNQYSDGYMSDSEAQLALQKVLPVARTVEMAMDEGRLLRQVKLRKKAISAVKHRYQLGELSVNGVVNALVTAGVAQEEANLLAASWEKFQSVKGKMASLSQLCKWWGEGLLTVAEYERRLLNVGWTKADVIRIIGTCQEDKALKDAKAASKGNKPPKTTGGKKPPAGG